MAYRGDLIVYWGLSPRIIEVPIPSVELDLQDLYDTLRTYGETLTVMDDDEIVDAGGKEPLGGGVSNGLTVKLLNAKVKFENRTSDVVCNISGGNLVAVDVDGNYMEPTEFSEHVTLVRTSSSSATIIANDKVAIANSVWDKAISEMTDVNTIGAKLLKDNVFIKSNL